MKYRVTFKKSYMEINFDFEEMTQASSFAYEALEAAVDDEDRYEFTVTLSVVKGEEND